MPKANVLVIDSGGRGHAIAQFLKSSPSVDRVWCYPGNAGTDQFCEPIKATTKLNNPRGLLDIASMFKVDLTVVGPELPAVSGVADVFENAWKLILCPTKAAAQLEGSKIRAKTFMNKYGIPTAPFDIYGSPSGVQLAAANRDWKCAIKADGLCGGKGVHVCTTKEEVEAAIDDLITKQAHDGAGEVGVTEDLLVGTETSFFVLADGRKVLYSGTAGDHKRAYTGDKGPNTGGMGAFNPDPYVDKHTRRRMLQIAQATLEGLAAEGVLFTGFLFIGFMITLDGIFVLEYNVRLGDPEAQVILPSIDTGKIDSYQLLKAAAEGNLGETQIPWLPGVRVGVVLTSGNYPGKERDGFKAKITGPIRTGEIEGVHIYHGATTYDGKDFYAGPGRVLTVSAPGSTYQAAIDRAYEVVEKIHFDGMRYRIDIGKRAALFAAAS